MVCSSFFQTNLYCLVTLIMGTRRCKQLAQHHYAPTPQLNLSQVLSRQNCVFAVNFTVYFFYNLILANGLVNIGACLMFPTVRLTLEKQVLCRVRLQLLRIIYLLTRFAAVLFKATMLCDVITTIYITQRCKECISRQQHPSFAGLQTSSFLIS